MNILIDNVDLIVKNRIQEAFNTDFRYAIMFELLMQDRKLSKQTKLYQSIKIFYPNHVENIEKAIDNILWFYGGGKDSTIKKETKETKKKQIYSYEFDANLIYAAFKSQYNIDLQKDKLHWWIFKAMFEGLNKDNKIVEIMGYRAMDISKIKDKEEKNKFKELKKIYALPDMRTLEEKEADFGEAFW